MQDGLWFDQGRCALEEASGARDKYYSNKLVRLCLTVIEDIMGGNGVAAALSLARLEHLIGNCPPHTLGRDFSFESFAAVNQAIVEMHGPQRARGLCVRAGRASLRHAVAESGLMANVPDPAFQLLPVGAKVKVGLNTLADVLSKLSEPEVKRRERAGELVVAVET